MLQFESVYFGSFPDKLMCNSEMQLHTLFKQSTRLNPRNPHGINQINQH